MDGLVHILAGHSAQGWLLRVFTDADPSVLALELAGAMGLLVVMFVLVGREST